MAGEVERILAVQQTKMPRKGAKIVEKGCLHFFIAA